MHIIDSTIINTEPCQERCLFKAGVDASSCTKAMSEGLSTDKVSLCLNMVVNNRARCRRKQRGTAGCQSPARPGLCGPPAFPPVSEKAGSLSPSPKPLMGLDLLIAPLLCPSQPAGLHRYDAAGGTLPWMSDTGGKCTHQQNPDREPLCAKAYGAEAKSDAEMHQSQARRNHYDHLV